MSRPHRPEGPRRWFDLPGALRRHRARKRLLEILENPYISRDIGLEPRDLTGRRPR